MGAPALTALLIVSTTVGRALAACVGGGTRPIPTVAVSTATGPASQHRRDKNGRASAYITDGLLMIGGRRELPVALPLWRAISYLTGTGKEPCDTARSLGA